MMTVAIPVLHQKMYQLIMQNPELTISWLDLTREADSIIFMVDVLDGVTPVDMELAELLRRSGKPLALAANKADNEQRSFDAAQFYQLSLGDPAPVSAYHDLGITDLLNSVVERLPYVPPEEETDMLKVAIVGRPNVGKSMLLNAILGRERTIVDDRPGTTRDAIDTVFEYEGGRMLLIDTAGIRRRGRVEGGIERYSVARALRAIGRADVALLVTEAIEPVTAQDTHIAGYVQQAFKGMVLVVNKWDLVEEEADRKQFTREIRRRLKFMPYVPVIYTSALHGKGIGDVLSAAGEVFESRQRRVNTSQLNNAVQDIMAGHAPPAVAGRKLKVLYATQAEINPPTFVFSVNDPALLHFSYRRYLENELRQRFDFQGTPLKLVFKRRGRE